MVEPAQLLYEAYLEGLEPPLPGNAVIKWEDLAQREQGAWRNVVLKAASWRVEP